MNNINQKKIVLIIGGHDPSGGAGIQADIESVTHAGCQATSIITSLTAQNTQRVSDIIPQDSDSFQKQIRLIFEDMKIDACKIGMLGDPKLIEIISNELSDKKFPIVFDPIINAASGKLFADDTIREKMISLLTPITTILTPNSVEARKLTNEEKEIYENCGLGSAV